MAIQVGTLTNEQGQVYPLFRVERSLAYFTRYMGVDVVLPVTPRDNGSVIRVRQLPGERFTLTFDVGTLDLIEQGLLRTEVGGLPLRGDAPSPQNLTGPPAGPREMQIVTGPLVHAPSRGLPVTKSSHQE